jgi:hypothetical protein
MATAVFGRFERATPLGFLARVKPKGLTGTVAATVWTRPCCDHMGSRRCRRSFPKSLAAKLFPLVLPWENGTL